MSEDQKPYISAMSTGYGKAMIDKYDKEEERNPEDMIMEASTEPDDDKPLTGKQIESEGWASKGVDAFRESFSKSFLYSGNKTPATALIDYWQEQNRIIVEIHLERVTLDNSRVYNGFCHSISQFRLLMQLIGIK